MPTLFVHTTRKDWGVGVLAWEAGGKRGYLFENGEERTMASGFHELMRRVERPSPEQAATSVRLQRVLTLRAGSSAAGGAAGPSFSDQLSRLHETYPEGLADPKWIKSVRGEGVELRASAHRNAAVQEAHEQLSSAALDPLIAGQRFDQVWERVVGVLSRTDLVPAAQLKRPKAASPEQLRDLAVAVRELLHGKASFEQRFDRYVAALSAYAGEPARWEIATALAALVYPSEHVCVHPTPFRLQLKATGSRGTAAARPTSAGYTRLLAVARNVAKKLGEHSEVPRDLLDVHDFIRITLKPVAKLRVASPKASTRKSAPPASVEAEDDEDAPDAQDDD